VQRRDRRASLNNVHDPIGKERANLVRNEQSAPLGAICVSMLQQICTFRTLEGRETNAARAKARSISVNGQAWFKRHPTRDDSLSTRSAGRTNASALEQSSIAVR